MNCTTARGLIESYLDGELNPSQIAEMQDHLSTCSECAEIEGRLRELQMNIRTQAPYYEAPAGLQQSVRSALAREARRSSFPQWLAIAATILLCVSLAFNIALLRSHREDRDTLAQSVVSSHVRSLIGTHLLDVPSSDQHTVKPWCNGKLDVSPDVKDFASRGFPLIGGRIEYIGNRPAAALVYQRRQHVINVFVWPAESSAGELIQNGYNMVYWSRAGMTYWAVSDLNLDELRQFAGFYAALR